MTYILVELENTLQQIRDHLTSQLKPTDTVIAVHEKWIHTITKQLSALYKAKGKLTGGLSDRLDFTHPQRPTNSVPWGFPVDTSNCSPTVRDLYVHTYAKLRQAELAHLDELAVELKAAYTQWSESLALLTYQEESTTVITPEMQASMEAIVNGLKKRYQGEQQ